MWSEVVVVVVVVVGVGVDATGDGGAGSRSLADGDSPGGSCYGLLVRADIYTRACCHQRRRPCKRVPQRVTIIRGGGGRGRWGEY